MHTISEDSTHKFGSGSVSRTPEVVCVRLVEQSDFVEWSRCIAMQVGVLDPGLNSQHVGFSKQTCLNKHESNIFEPISPSFYGLQFIVVSLKEGMFNNANVLFRTKFTNGMSTVSRIAQSNWLWSVWALCTMAFIHQLLYISLSPYFFSVSTQLFL